MHEKIEIKQLAIGDLSKKNKWDQFVFAFSDSTFFHRAGWQDVISGVFGHKTVYLYAERDDEIVGVLPLVCVSSRLFGKSLASLPFGVYGGIASSVPDASSLLEKSAKSWAQMLKVDYLEFRNIQPRNKDWPTQDLYVTFRKTLLPDEEQNMLAIPRKQRAMVRKGIKNELSGEIDSGVERFFSLYANNVLRHGTPAMPKRYFQALKKEFGADCEILTVVDKNNIALSSVMSFYFKNEVLPYYAGDDESARHLAANDFKYWELMRRACQRGIEIFDYGRSKKDTGSYSFKKNWGFSPSQLHYEYDLYNISSIPQNNPNNKKYKLMIEIWKRLPIKVANFIGPHIVKNLG
ncbi:FemAB family XrtA/PEP-CTERM system-associated protein [Variovorax sp. HJSM1_2]|uniref:FemAB family XrtA/PEP-CTERM system-associated protein n=1 Tax=Variovorax sp. HJSM1_2 TaxID=3366263 RepID=UPI003BD1C9F5